VSWRLTTRVGGRVDKQTFATRDEALAALETECRAIANTRRRAEVKVARRTYSPVVQVQARAELRGPGRAAGGVDVRGDGSVEAYVGRLRRRVVEQQRGESAYAALRRALGSDSAAP
jgi:hypothetical protein